MINSVLASLFQDSFLSKFIIPLGHNLTAVAKVMSSERFVAIVSISCIAALLAAIANYTLGFIIYKLYSKYIKAEDLQNKLRQLEGFFDHYGSAVLFLGAFVFLGAFATFVAGFARFSPLRSVIYITLGSAIYYLLI